MKWLLGPVWCIIMVIQILLYYLFDYTADEDYFIYTHRKGWIHISEATKQDIKEKSGIGIAYAYSRI